MARVMLLSARHAHSNEDYMTARSCLRRAEEIAETLHACDRKKLKPQLRKFYKQLEASILKTSMKSAQKLRSIGRIYEDARFPIEELKPEMATEVAMNVGASQLFLIRKKNKGFRVPIRYNISRDEAKRMIRFQLRTNEALFDAKDPVVIPLPSDQTLVCVPGQGGVGYLLCTLIDSDQSFSPRELEFLFASVEAMEKVAEEYSDVPPYLDVDDFMEGEGKLTHPGGHFQDIMTLDPEMIKIIRLASRASEPNVPILLEGETGVGKELFAQAIHAQSLRGHKPFIAMNAGGVPLNLLESQLFGHVKGAFTDAVTDRRGLVEEARGGTIFFDEVGEMAEELQVKLLRLLENGEFRRLGENQVRVADVRVVSATNKDLEHRVKKGLFREDLYYRLAAVKFRIPPLRNRKRDIEFLVRHFINEGLVRIGKPRRRINVDLKALEAFEFYSWPGNVRELRNELLRVLALIGPGELIRFGMLSEHIKTAFKSRSEDSSVLAKRVDRYERRLILKALADNEWNRVKTAEQIGIPRTTLLFRMKKLNIAR
jgi:DNA-binding NtrC family response regulator